MGRCVVVYASPTAGKSGSVLSFLPPRVIQLHCFYNPLETVRDGCVVNTETFLFVIR